MFVCCKYHEKKLKVGPGGEGVTMYIIYIYIYIHTYIYIVIYIVIGVYKPTCNRWGGTSYYTPCHCDVLGDFISGPHWPHGTMSCHFFCPKWPRRFVLEEVNLHIVQHLDSQKEDDQNHQNQSKEYNVIMHLHRKKTANKSYIYI